MVKILGFMRSVALFLYFHSFLLSQTDPDPQRYFSSKIGKDLFIEQFIDWDSKNTFAKSGILFVGSSSIRLWPTNKYFRGNIINRGFGGSHLSDIIFYFDEIVSKYQPNLIFLYAGDNDIADKKSPLRLFNDFKKFVNLVNDNIESCSIVFIPIKPSPSRWGYWEKMKEANSLINDYAKIHEGIFYVDTATPMIGNNGKPIANLFVGDSLHLNSNGYDLWSSKISSFLELISTSDSILRE